MKGSRLSLDGVEHPEVDSENSWHSRSWSNIHYCRAVPVRSGHSWQGGVGQHTPCLGPMGGMQELQEEEEEED